MITRKHLLLAIGATCLLTMFVITVVPIRSDAGIWNPWYDVNDDNKIDGKDIALVASVYGTSSGGNDLNKTLLLIDVNNTFTELLNTIDSCNASLIDLQRRVTALESIDLPLNDTISTIQSRIDTLNASLLNLVSRVDSLNASVIDLQSRTTTLEGDVFSLNGSIISLLNRTSILEGRATSLENRTSILEGEVGQLQNNVTSLQNNIIALNSTVNWLVTTVNTLQTNFGIMNASLTQLNQTFNSLNSSFTSSINNLQAEINALEANYSVTNLDLAPSAIPYNVTSDTSHQYTTETAGFVDMLYTSVTLTLNRTSQLLIMFSADAGISSASVTENTWILCQATVNGTAATPGTIQLTPRMNTQLGDGYTHAHLITEGPCSFNFYYGKVNAGTYTIKIRWYLSATGQGDVWSRTLEVIGLPA